MMKRLEHILTLLAVTCFFAFSLFGFTIYHHEKLRAEETSVLPEFVCGTSAVDPYAIALRELES